MDELRKQAERMEIDLLTIADGHATRDYIFAQLQLVRANALEDGYRRGYDQCNREVNASLDVLENELKKGRDLMDKLANQAALKQLPQE